MMRAVCVHRFGGFDAVAYEEVPRPVPGEGRVLVSLKRYGCPGVMK